MARKYDLISDLYRRTAEDVVSDPTVWQAFLRCASRNYRLRFDEQLLLFAQRPDATAVLPIERWNQTFGRWVNRGAKGIAMFENTGRNRQRLVHYFDISDTHESRYSHPVPIWQMQAAYTDAVIETLENTFGKLQDKTDLQSAVLSAVQNAVEDNLPDYLQDFMNLGGNSDLAYLSEEEANDLYKELVLHSTAFMVLSRLGADTSELYPPDFFDGVSSFNTPETVNALGVAISDISEMALGAIARTVWSLNKKDRILAENEKAGYNRSENLTERSFEDEQTDHTRRGDYSLPDLTVPDQPAVPLGRYAQMRRKFLMEHHRILYCNLLTNCTLTQHLAETQQTALKLEESLMHQMAEREGLTESLKAADMMAWVQKMNNLKNRVQEIVLAQVIFV